jgi:hypothetical protein
METTNFQPQEQTKETFIFPLSEEKQRNRGEYFASYYQQNREQIKRARVIRYKAQKLGLKCGTINGVFGGGTKKATKPKREINHDYYLKAEQSKRLVNEFVGSFARPHPNNQRKDYRKEKDATKPNLRHCGTILNNIHSILNCANCPPYSLITKNKGGRPRSDEATKLNRPLTSTERSQKRRAFLKANQPTNKWQRLLLKMLDIPSVRLQTNIKVPWKAGRKLNGWQT